VRVAGRSDRGRWRRWAWGLLAGLALLPLVATALTDALDWDGADFAAFGGLLLAAGGLFELALRHPGGAAYRAGVAVALGTGVLLAWVNAAVGLIGSEGDPVNRLYAGVLGVGLIGAAMARLRPAGMARAMLATALAQALVAVFALAGGFVPAGAAPGLVAGTAVLVGLWLASAWLFRRAARPLSGAAR
jgi:hypothetical protein